ncbi:hypothetical protein UPYG_G00339380 [Umbra pygmaea]|uniref:Ig-like domain-containing protein n=1 Tax=Umbra pygmaea TaxID=75934 RepID=A0ABD0VWZ9_UMBPY
MDLFHMRSLVLMLSAVGFCKGQDAPVISGSISAVVGKNVTFITTINANDFGDFLTISWNYKKPSGDIPVVTSVPKGDTYGEGYKGRTALNTSNGQLNIALLTGADSGSYSVNMVTNKGLSHTGLIMLKVLDPVSTVIITSNVSQPVEFNSTVALTCTAQGSELNYKWLNGTVPVVADGSRVILSPDNKVLTVVGVYRNDLAGPIYCTAYNVELATSAPFNLTVSYGPENIFLTALSNPMILIKGSNITLNCSAQSSPAASLQWSLNGLLLPAKGPTLVLANAVEAQSGNYSCIAYNAQTLRYLASTTTTITLIAPLSGANITGLTGNLIAGNSSVNLSCQATSGIPTQIVWKKDDREHVPSNRVVFSADKSSFMINPVQKEDSGQYQCKVKNAVSEDFAYIRMRINYGPEKVVITGKHSVHVDDLIQLMCEANSVPAATYAWMFNGSLVGLPTNNYTINLATLQNTGTYTCLATNSITGRASTSDHKVLVIEKGIPLPLDEEDGLTGACGRQNQFSRRTRRKPGQKLERSAN